MNGYWQGGRCDSCLSGYMGTTCQQRSNSVAQLRDITAVSNASSVATFLAVLNGTVAIGTSTASVLFDARAAQQTTFTLPAGSVCKGILNFFVLDAATAAQVFASKIPQQSPLSGVLFAIFSTANRSSVTLYVCTTYSLDAGAGVGIFSSLIVDSSNNIGRNFAVSTFGYNLIPVNSSMPSISQTHSYSFFDRATGNICVIPALVDGFPGLLQCRHEVTGASFTTLMDSIPSVRFAFQSTLFPGNVWIGGTSVAKICRLMLFSLSSSTSAEPILFTSTLQQLNVSACVMLDCATEVSGVVYFGLESEYGFIGAIDLTTMTSRGFSGSYVGFNGQRCGAIFFDATSQMGLVNFGNLILKFTTQQQRIQSPGSEAAAPNASAMPSAPVGGNSMTSAPANSSANSSTSQQFSTSLTGLVAYGQLVIQLAGTGIRSFAFDPEQRVVYGNVDGSLGVDAVRYLLAEIYSLSPVLATRGGGTVITVTGRGFLVPSASTSTTTTTTTVCNFGGSVFQPARVINSTLIECVAPGVDSNDICVTSSLEIGIVPSNAAAGAAAGLFTSNGLSVNMYQSPVITGVNPSVVYVRQPELIILRGSNMIASTFSVCLFVDDESFEQFVSPAKFSAADAGYTCISPNASIPWSPSTKVSLSLDGQIFTSNAFPFRVVGDPNDFVLSTIVLSVVSGLACTPSDVLTMTVTDLRGNRIGSQDRNVWNASMNLTSSSTTASLANSFTAAKSSFLAVSGLATIIENGTGVFDRITMYKPLAGTYKFSLAIAQGLGSVTSVSIVVTPGALSSILVTTQPISNDTYIQPGQPPPSVVTVVASDEAGNVVTSTAGQRLRVMLVPRSARGAANMSNASSSSNSINTTSTFFYNTSSPGTIILSNIAFGLQGSAAFFQSITPVLGVTYVIYFSTLDTAVSISAMTIPFQAQCNPSEFQIYGESACRACLVSSSSCNGSNVIVGFPGLWRHSSASVTFYPCLAAEACTGDWSCTTGYTGPLCELCESDYGKTFSGQCMKCWNVGINIVVLLVLLLIVVIFLTMTSIAVTQNMNHATSVIGSTVISSVQTLQFLQTLSLISIISYDLKGVFLSAIKLLYMISNFDFLTIQPLDCLLRSTMGLSSVHVPLLYAGLFVTLPPIVTVCARQVLRRNPRFLCCEEAVVDVDKTLLMSEQELELIGWKIYESGDKSRRYVKHHQPKRIVVLAACSALTMFFQPALLSCLQVLQCQDVVVGLNDATEVLSYIRTDKSVLCQDPRYAQVTGFVYLLLAAYCVFPVFLVLALGGARRAFSEDDFMIYSSGFLYGVKFQRFFWPTIAMLRQVFLVVVVSNSSFPLSAYCFMWTLVLMAVFEYSASPYLTNRNNNLELLGTSLTIILANVALLFSRLSDSRSALVVSGVLLFGTCCGCAAFLWQVLKEPLGLYKAKRRLEKHIGQDPNHLVLSTSIDVHLSHLIGSEQRRDKYLDDDETQKSRRTAFGRKQSTSSPRQNLRSLFDDFGDLPDVDPLQLLAEQHEEHAANRRRQEQTKLRRHLHSSSDDEARSSSVSDSDATSSASVSSTASSSSTSLSSSDDDDTNLTRDERREELRRQLEFEMDIDNFIARNGMPTNLPLGSIGGGGASPGAATGGGRGSKRSGSVFTFPTKKRASERSAAVAKTRPNLVKRAVRQRLLATSTEQETSSLPEPRPSRQQAGDDVTEQSFEQLAAAAEARALAASDNSDGGGPDERGGAGPVYLHVIPPIGGFQMQPEQKSESFLREKEKQQQQEEENAAVMRQLREQRVARMDQRNRLAELEKQLFVDSHNDAAVKVVTEARGACPSPIVRRARKGLRSQWEASESASSAFAAGPEGEDGGATVQLKPPTLF